jgi:hypothetical protein
MRQLAALVLLAVAGALPTLAAAEATRSTQILQQRTPDGSILLTDRPSPGAKTERSWQVNVEDPAAARQRAIDVKAEANLVAERVQRMLDQQRRADDDAQRMRLASLQLERDRLAGLDAQDGIAYGSAFGGGRPVPFRASRFPGPRIGDVGIIDPPGTRRMGGRHGGHGKPSGSGSRGNHSRW